MIVPLSFKEDDDVFVEDVRLVIASIVGFTQATVTLGKKDYVVKQNAWTHIYGVVSMQIRSGSKQRGGWITILIRAPNLKVLRGVLYRKGLPEPKPTAIKKTNCSTCKGSGELSQFVICFTCKGTGCRICNKGHVKQIFACPDC